MISEENSFNSPLYYRPIQQIQTRPSNRFYYCCFCLSSSTVIFITLFTILFIYILNAIRCEKYLCNLLLHHDISSCVDDRVLSHSLMDIKNEICIKYI